MREQLEPVHGQAQVGEGGERRRIGGLLFHAALHAEETLAQGALLLGVTELEQEPPHLVGETPGLRDLAQRGGEPEPAGLVLLEHAALKNAALSRPVRVEPAGAVRAQGAARLGKAGDGLPGAREGHRQSQRLQSLRIVARLELHAVEERAVAAQAAGEAKLFAGGHAPASGVRRPERKPGGFIVGVPTGIRTPVTSAPLRNAFFRAKIFICDIHNRWRHCHFYCHQQFPSRRSKPLPASLFI